MSTTRSTLQMETNLRKLAQKQSGLFSASQAEAIGFSYRSLQLRLATGHVERCFSGVYRLASVPKSFEQVCLAACLATAGALAGTTAGLLHGFPVGRRPVAPEIVLPHGVQFRSSGIVVHQTRFYPGTQPWLTGRVTTPAATMIPLAKVLDRTLLARCLDFGLANRLLTVEQVVDELKDRVRFRGRRNLLSELAARSNGKLLFRSTSEMRVRRWMRKFGLPEPESNVLVETPLGTFEVDFLWRSKKIALEVSPFYTHGSKEQQERDALKRRALTLAGYLIVEATDVDIVSAVAFGKTAEALHHLMRG